MIFLSWGRPTLEQQQSCLDKSNAFNYDAKYRGASAKSLSKLKEDHELVDAGFSINHARVLIGSGVKTFEKGKEALQTWRHFGLNWAFVDPRTPTKIGVKFCVCVKELLPWVMMPLEVVYVNESRKGRKVTASFGFGGGTLKGHLLAGEERFSVELDDEGQVWYEVVSFSKPANFLSFLGYPYVQFRQKHFAKHSSDAVVNHVKGS